MKVLRAVKQIGKSTLDRGRWLFGRSRNANLKPIQVHMLVVNKSIYAKLAHFCALTFLFHNPNSRILIHHDKATTKSLKLRFLLLATLKHKKISFIELQTSEEWQIHKLKIILDLMGSHDYFMDCDLKWNGALLEQEHGRITYFVKEKIFSDYRGLSEILIEIPIAPSRAIMRNTSLFSWQGITLDTNQIKEFNLLVRSLQINSRFFIHGLQTEFHRIYEQICLSLIPELYSKAVGYLKQSDGQFDGSICESSYYGASRGRFAWWGNTSRSSLLR